MYKLKQNIHFININIHHSGPESVSVPDSVTMTDNVRVSDNIIVPGTISMHNNISLTDKELFAVPVVIESNDDVFIDINPVVNAALDNIEDQVENGASRENVIENENIVDKILEQENTSHNLKTPVKEHANEENNTPETISAIPNTPESLNRKRSFSRAFKYDDVKNKMSKGWLAKVVEDPSAYVVGYLQIFSSKNMEVKGKPLTLFKASDGQYVTWNDALEPEISQTVPDKSVIVIEASF